MTASQYAASQFRFHYTVGRTCKFGRVRCAAHAAIKAVSAYRWLRAANATRSY